MMLQTRREFLRAIGAAAAAAKALETTTAAPMPDPAAVGWVDTNAYLGQWPFRRVAGDLPNNLVERLRARGVAQAWVGSFEGLLHKDLDGVNQRLAQTCAAQPRGFLLPFGSVNPNLSGWQRDLERCRNVHRMPGIRLHPNYHGYTLDDPRFAELLAHAAQLGLVVQLAVVMEDERMMHPLARVAAVDVTPLPTRVAVTPGLRLLLLNALRTVRARPLLDLIAAGNVHVEIALLEGVGALETLLEQIPANRICFGSYSPLFYFEAAVLKLKESSVPEPALSAIRSGNAQALLRSP